MESSINPHFPVKWILHIFYIFYGGQNIPQNIYPSKIAQKKSQPSSYPIGWLLRWSLHRNPAGDTPVFHSSMGSLFSNPLDPIILCAIFADTWLVYVGITNFLMGNIYNIWYTKHLSAKIHGNSTMVIVRANPPVRPHNFLEILKEYKFRPPLNFTIGKINKDIRNINSHPH